jgi:hypothetical protein
MCHVSDRLLKEIKMRTEETDDEARICTNEERKEKKMPKGQIIHAPF